MKLVKIVRYGMGTLTVIAMIISSVAFGFYGARAVTGTIKTTHKQVYQMFKHTNEADTLSKCAGIDGQISIKVLDSEDDNIKMISVNVINDYGQRIKVKYYYNILTGETTLHQIDDNMNVYEGFKELTYYCSKEI